MILLHYKRQFRNTQRKPGSCLSGLPAHRTFLGWRVSDSAPDTVWPLSSFTGRPMARLAKYAIERAEAEGLLKPGDTIVEASSGNTGNALSMVAAVKGYRMLVVMPHGLSCERVAISRAYRAEVLMVGDFHVIAALA